MSNLTELLDRLKAATGPDRELGHDILMAAGWIAPPIYHEHRKAGGHYPEDWEGDDEYVKFDAINSEGFWKSPDGPKFSARELPDITASVDDALALAEQMLPGVWYVMAKGRMSSEEPLYGCELLFSHDTQIAIAEGATQPLSILAAALNAAQGGK